MTLAEALKHSPSLRIIVDVIDKAIRYMQANPNFLKQQQMNRKRAQEFMEYQHADTMVRRALDRDRVFPLDTVAIQEYRTEYKGNLETAMIHTGPAADEIARSMNALAVTIAGDIYFRNNAFNPSDEEGRKLLAHELTHVTQYSEKRITRQTTTEELENEAIKAESAQGYDPDPYVTVPVGNKAIRIRSSAVPELVHLVANNVEDWVAQQRTTLDERSYLELLCAYESWLGEAH
jgi:hypothetical protein